jgi:hypothetical protein
MLVVIDRRSRMRRNDYQGDEDYDQRREGGPRAVENWFERSGVRNTLPQRLHGVSADWLVGELVRTGDSRRTSASMKAREAEPNDRAPGAGEWRGPTFKIRPDVGRRNEGPYEHRGQTQEEFEERMEDFGQVLQHAREDPYYRHQLLTQFADGFYGFNDRKREGRRHRPTDDRQLLEGPQEPYPHPGPMDESRYRSW